jgi:hypothetical protein
MSIIDLKVESSNRVGNYNANTKNSGESLNATVFGMATTFCQVIQAFSQARASTKVNPFDTSLLGFDLEGVEYEKPTLKISKINPGILFYKNIPYIVPEIKNLSLNLSSDLGKAYGVRISILDMAFTNADKSVLDDTGIEINMNVPSKAIFPFKIFWDEISVENEISPDVISSDGNIYVFTITRNINFGSMGWQINHSCFKPNYVMNTLNTFNGRERSDGTIEELLNEFPTDKTAYYNKYYDVGDLAFFHNTMETQNTFPFIPMSTPLTVIDKEKYPDFFEYLHSYKLPLRLYIDGWEWDALPYQGKSEKAGTRYNLPIKHVSKYGYDFNSKKQNIDTESAGEKGTYGRCTFRLYLSKTKKTIFNNVNNTYIDNKILLSILNDLPMHPVRFPDLSNLMLDNDPSTPLGAFTQDPTAQTQSLRTNSVEAERTVDGNLFKIKDTTKPQYLKKDLGFNKVKGVVGTIKIDPNPNLIVVDEIETVLNTMPQSLLETLELDSNKESRSLFLTAYNGNTPAITETESHIIIEIDDFLYNNEVLSKITFLSSPDKPTTPYYLEIFPYRIPQTPYFERIPMNVPAHKQIYAPNPLGLSQIGLLATRLGAYSIENYLKEDLTPSTIDTLGEDENFLRSEPAILRWNSSGFKANINGAVTPPDSILDPDLTLVTSVFKNGMRIPFDSSNYFQQNFESQSLRARYAIGKTCGTPVLGNLTPTKDVNYKLFKETGFDDPMLSTLYTQKEKGYNGFEIKNPIYESINRSSWWLLDGSHREDEGLLSRKTLRAKIQYNQVLKFFVDSDMIAPSQLPLAQKNTKKTLILTGHSQLGGCPKTGDLYGYNSQSNTLNITQYPDINSSKGTEKPDLHGIILNMRHLKLNAGNQSPVQYDYLYYMPKIPRFQQSFNNLMFNNYGSTVTIPKAGQTAQTLYFNDPFSFYNAIITAGISNRFGVSNTSNATDGVRFLSSNYDRISQEYSYPRFGIFLNRKFGDNSSPSTERYNALSGYTPNKMGFEANFLVNNYILIPFSSISNLSGDTFEYVQPNIGMYLRLTHQGYDSNGTVNDIGKKEIFLWQSFGILPAWFFTERHTVNSNYIVRDGFGAILGIYPSSFDVTIQYPGWVIFGDESINGNICIPPVALTNALYPNQVTSRNIALVFLQSIFASKEAVTDGLFKNALNSPAMNGGYNKNFPRNFFKYTEATVDSTHAMSTAWGLSNQAGLSLDQFANNNDPYLMPTLVSLYWEDIRGTWLHDYYQEISLSSLLEKRKIDRSVTDFASTDRPGLNTEPPNSMGDYSSLFMLAIDYSTENIMKPGERYAVYYPNQNSQGSMSMDEYIQIYLNNELNAQDSINTAISGEKYIKVPYYGKLSNPVLNFSNQPIAPSVREWHFKRKSHSTNFFNFSSWISYYRKCVREYAMSLGINGFDGLFSPKEQNFTGLITGGGLIKGKNNIEYLDQLEILKNGIPDNVNNAPEPSPQYVVSSDISVGNTKGGNEWNNPNLSFPHKKTDKFKREFEAYGSNGKKLGKLIPVSKMNGIPYIYVGRILA